MHSKLNKPLLTIIALLLSFSMVAKAMPIVSEHVPQHEQMSMMDMADMEMSSCQHADSNKSCDHCDDQHQCNISHSGCASSTAIPSNHLPLSVVRSIYSAGLMGTEHHLLQRTTLLYRPPIFA